MNTQKACYVSSVISNYRGQYSILNRDLSAASPSVQTRVIFMHVSLSTISSEGKFTISLTNFGINLSYKNCMFLLKSKRFLFLSQYVCFLDVYPILYKVPVNITSK